MVGRYNRDQRMEYLNMTNRIGQRWVDVFEGNVEFYSAAYWDLLTGVWHAAGPVRKTDALKFMTAVKSAHTAGKYVDAAVDHGVLVETENPEDARSRLLDLSPPMRLRLDDYFESAVDELRRSTAAVTSAGSLPDIS